MEILPASHTVYLQFIIQLFPDSPTWTFGEDNLPLFPRTGFDTILSTLSLRWTWTIRERKNETMNLLHVRRSHVSCSCALTCSAVLLRGGFRWLTFLRLLKQHREKPGHVLKGHTTPNLYFIDTQLTLSTFLCLTQWNSSFHNIAPHFWYYFYTEK